MKKNFEYYGLFLTDESKSTLDKWLVKNGYEISGKKYLDHCTLMHRSDDLDLSLIKLYDSYEGLRFFMLVTGIGISDKAMAFRVSLIMPCSSKRIPHITICTIGDGKPYDSNFIPNWTRISDGLLIDGILKSV